MEVIVQEAPLSPVEQTRLKALEAVIQENFLAYVAVGNALLEIRENKLYRTNEGRTWEGYCRQIWDMSHDYADRTVAASKVVKNLLTIVSKKDGSVDHDLLPANEAQARELARLEPDEQKQVWQQLIDAKREEAPAGEAVKVTAKSVKNAVKKLKGEQLSSSIDQAKKEVKSKTPANTNRQSAEFVQAWELFMEQIEVERQANWKNTSRTAVFNCLERLARVVGDRSEPTVRDRKICWRSTNVEKLLQAGFGIYRKSADNKMIEKMESAGIWLVYGEYEDATKYEEVFADLLLDAKNIQA